MAEESEAASDDPVLRWLLRFESGLKAGGEVPGYEVLATYWTRDGERPFAFCRDGLLIDPGGAARFVPFAEIEDAGYYNITMIKRAKAARCGEPPEPLEIGLRSGERIALPLEVRDDGMPDLLDIAKLIHRRAAIFRPRSG